MPIKQVYRTEHDYTHAARLFGTHKEWDKSTPLERHVQYMDTYWWKCPRLRERLEIYMSVALNPENTSWKWIEHPEEASSFDRRDLFEFTFVDNGGDLQCTSYHHRHGQPDCRCDHRPAFYDALKGIILLTLAERIAEIKGPEEKKYLAACKKLQFNDAGDRIGHDVEYKMKKTGQYVRPYRLWRADWAKEIHVECSYCDLDTGNTMYVSLSPNDIVLFKLKGTCPGSVSSWALDGSSWIPSSSRRISFQSGGRSRRCPSWGPPRRVRAARK